MNDAERDQLLSDMRVDVAEIRVRIEAVPDHEGRIRKLERFRYAFPSLALLTFAATVALGALTIFH